MELNISKDNKSLVLSAICVFFFSKEVIKRMEEECGWEGSPVHTSFTRITIMFSGLHLLTALWAYGEKLTSSGAFHKTHPLLCSRSRGVALKACGSRALDRGPEIT